MPGEIVVIKDIAADNTDVLAGTDLENIPGIGNLDVFVVSTQADTIFTITAPGQATPLREQLAQLKTNAVVSQTDDMPVSLDCFGGRYIISVNIVTGATVKCMVVFTPAEDED